MSILEGRYNRKVKEIVEAGKEKIRDTNPQYYELRDIALLAQLAVNIQILEMNICTEPMQESGADKHL